MASLNKVMLIGNLTRDPEIRYTPKGTALAEIGLAVNRRYTAENGEKREETTFVDVTMWGKTAELAEKYLKKGNPVYIEGRLRLDSWDDKTTGAKRSKLSVVCEEMQFLGGRDSSSEGRGGGDYEDRPARPAQRPASRPSSPPKAPVDPDRDVEGDDIPF
jgi:single-strand DNA-binding protein